jgi:bifunctional non-homologous end joining protein LigD
MWSRNRLSWLGRFPEVAAALRSMPIDDFTFDGELVAFDGERSSFALLQAPTPAKQPIFCAFDLLDLLGRDTTGLPWTERSGLLARALTAAGPLVIGPQRVEGEPAALLADACRRGWEGLIAKRAASPYRPGRSPDWRKLKCTARQEFVIGGWTEPEGSRTGFGALLLGYYDDSGSLRFAGKVGTGFDERTLHSIRAELELLARPDPPFGDPVPLRRVHWADPTLVAEVDFSEWTRDGRLRHPSFVGLRTDKDPASVRAEPPGPGPGR